MSRRKVHARLPATPEPGHATIAYPCPLERGGVAYLSVPRTLTIADTERIAAMLRTLVRDTDAAEAPR